MSNAVFPDLAGRNFELTRAPIWSTTTKVAASGREYRIANWTYPRYEYKLSYDVLRETLSYTELQQLAGFFNARGGSFDSFLFTDPDDNSVTGQNIGTGDASTKTFQLVRTFGSYVEPVYDTNSTPAIYANGSLQSTPAQYSINSSGLVTFVSAPASGANISWTGTYYRRVRFVEDKAEFKKFMYKLWNLGQITLVSVKP